MVFLGIVGGVIALIALILRCPLQAVLSYDGELTIKWGIPLLMTEYYADYESMLSSDKFTPEQKRKILNKLIRREKKAEKEAEKRRKKNEKLIRRGKKPIPEPRQNGVADLLRKKRKAKRNIRFLLRLAWILLRRFGSKLKIRINKLKIVIASEDAATTAYLFGTVSQGVSYLLAAAEQLPDFAYSNKRLELSADFLRDECRLEAEVYLSIRIGSLLKLFLFPKTSQPPLIDSVKKAAETSKKSAPVSEKGIRHESEQA